VLFFGGREVSGDTFRLHYEELTLRGAFHHTPRTVRRALTFLATGARPWEKLVTHEVGLDGLARLFADPPHDLLKAAVRP
jgi:L-iditol 2-dehydrogenase